MNRIRMRVKIKKRADKGFSKARNGERKGEIK